jgi:ribokinase
MKKLLVYGDIAMDVIVKTASISELEEDTNVDDLAITPGGSAANCAAIASDLGLTATFLGNIGNDQWSKLLEKDLKKHHINIKYLNHMSGLATICISIVNGPGNRKFYSYRGVNEISSIVPIPDSFIKQHQCIHLSGYSFQNANSAEMAMELVQSAKKHNLLVSLDPSYLFARDLDLANNEILKNVDFFYPNREEAYQLTKLHDPLKAAQKIREYGPKVVIVTLDKDGCLVVGDDIQQTIKINNDEKVIDTTGAGDAFCAGFLTGVLNGLPLDQSCKIGSAAASHIIARLGAHEYPPSGRDILNILEKNNDKEFVGILKKSFDRNRSWRQA